MKRQSAGLLCLLCLAFVIAQFSRQLYQSSAAWSLSRADPKSSQFRQMEFGSNALKLRMQEMEETGFTLSELLTIRTPFDGFRFSQTPKWSTEEYASWRALLFWKNRDGYEQVHQMYAAIWDDIRCFPVAADSISYENSWMFERTYGGLRGHEGTDLMPAQNIPGYYSVVSVSDGVVEKIGWLPKGGWRIGIRSPSGGYFYYAHLDSYSRAFQIGEKVSAGEVLGLMGDSGYGEEGTRGKFAVHLHFGIYITTKEGEELSINPYWILRWLDSVASK